MKNLFLPTLATFLTPYLKFSILLPDRKCFSMKVQNAYFFAKIDGGYRLGTDQLGDNGHLWSELWVGVRGGGSWTLE